MFTAAGIGIAAQVVIVPTYFVLDLKRRRIDELNDWDALPTLARSERAA